MGSGGDAPDPDPRIGEAALRSAQLGEDYLAWARQRSKTTDLWARQDRNRSRGTFIPLQNAYINKAKTWASRGRQAQAAQDAYADVMQQNRVAQATTDRQLAAMGVNPASARYSALKRSTALSGSLAAAGAGNLARRQVRAEGDAMMANAINLGSGLAVNPLSSFSSGSQATAGGFQGAMQGQAQAGNLYSQQYQQQLQAWQANQGGGLAGTLGTVAGMVVDPLKLSGLASSIPFLGAIASDEKAKTKKRRAGRSLPALRAMRVEDWEYKPGAGDGGAAPHRGTYAGDFKKATGLGDGRSIPIVDAIGVAYGALQELDKKVTRIARSVKRPVAA